MTVEAVLTRILPAVERLLKAVVESALAPGVSPTLYDLEARTPGVLPHLGRVLLQEVTEAHGSGLVGPSRPCACGAEQRYLAADGADQCGRA